MTEPLLVIERQPTETLEGDEKLQIIEQMSKSEEYGSLDFENVEICRYSLSFYEDVELLVLTNADWQPLGVKLCFLVLENNMVRLNGTSPPIHQINAIAKLTLTRETVKDYLAFFCFFVRGEEGPFLLVDRLPHELVDDGLRSEEIEEQFRPPTIWGQAPNAAWRASGLVFYSDALFVADFTIELGGMVNMIDDIPLCSDLESSVNAPLEIEANTVN